MIGNKYFAFYPQDVVMLLLKFNADVSLINAEGHTAKEMAKDPDIKRIIEGQ